MDYRQPRTLFDNAAKVVGDNIALQAIEILKNWCTMPVNDIEDNKKLVLKTVEYFDTVIPKIFHDIVTKKALRYLNSQFNWIFLIIDPEFCISCISPGKEDFDPYKLAVYRALCSALFKRSARQKDLQIERSFLSICLRSHTAELSFLDWGYEMHNALFQCLPILKNLKRINLTSEALDENYNNVLTAIQEMKNLEIFECSCCTTNILKVVCDNCSLRKLDIGYSKHITDTSLTSVLKLQNLQKLNILDINFTEASIIKMLLRLPHLRAISTQRLLSTLAQITDSNIRFPILKVRCFLSTQEDLVNLTKYFPLLKKLTIFESKSINLLTLTELKHLEVLEIYGNVIHYDNIKTLIQSVGHKFTELVLCSLDLPSSSIRNEIESFCPNLKILFLGKL